MWWHIPTYHHYYVQADLTDSYEYYKRMVQLLQAKHNEQDQKVQKEEKREEKRLEEKRWVLKAPVHVGYIDTILKLFPDANIVWLHRDPIAAIPSCCSLFGHFRNVSVDDLDAKEVGDICLNYWSSQMQQGQKSYEKHKDRVLNIRYEDLIKDPIATVKRTYDYFGIPSYNSEFEDAMKAHLQTNTKDKHGAHSYSLGEFGLDNDKVKAAFADYYKTFIDTDSNTNYEKQLLNKREQESKEKEKVKVEREV